MKQPRFHFNLNLKGLLGPLRKGMDTLAFAVSNIVSTMSTSKNNQDFNLI